MGKQVAAGIIWGCSSVGRAPALQAGGQEFESLHLHCASIIRSTECRMKVYSNVHCTSKAKLSRSRAGTKVCTLKTAYCISSMKLST